jgi:GT2 family glycosyltransferase
VAATGPIYPIDSKNFWIRKGYEFVSVFLVRLSILVGRPAIVGSNFAVRASKFRAAGGFDESLMTYEDWALSNKIKKYGNVEYSKKAVVHTSARRIKSWGIFGYAVFYLTDAIMYKFTRRSRKMYEIVR